MVLRYTCYVDGPFDIKSTIKEGNQAYYNQDYETCIQLYLKILCTKHPKTFVYAKLGLAYMKMWNRGSGYKEIASRVAVNISQIANKMQAIKDENSRNVILKNFEQYVKLFNKENSSINTRKRKTKNQN